MSRNRLAAFAAAAAVAAALGVARDTHAQEQKIEKVPLLHADALLLSIAFGADPPKPPTAQQRAAYEHSAAGIIARQQQRILEGAGLMPPGPPAGPPSGLYEPGGFPGAPPVARLVAQARLAPPDATFQGELAQFLPQGLAGPPVAVERENALLVKGSSAAIDEFRETLRLFDVPVKQVNIRCDFVDTSRRQQQAWGVDLFATDGQHEGRVTGNRPAGNVDLRYQTGNFAAALSALATSSRSQDVVSPQVTTLDRSPAILTVGESIPYVQNVVSYGPFGNQLVQQVVDVVFVGVELFVVPRIHGDKVTMLIRPSLIDRTGSVVDPRGQQLPITRQVLVETVVTVRDGETLCIGGLPRSNWNTNAVFDPVVGWQGQVDSSDLLVFVTPRIIHQQEGNE